MSTAFALEIRGRAHLDTATDLLPHPALSHPMGYLFSAEVKDFQGARTGWSMAALRAGNTLNRIAMPTAPTLTRAMLSA